LHDQLVAWSADFAVYMGLICVITRSKFKSVAVPKPNEDSDDKQSAPVSIEQGLTWLLLAGFASALLVATTNRIGQDVPAIPFLFVLPLCLYLITFIIAFDGPRGYVRPLFYVLLPVGLSCAWYDLHENVNLELVVRVALYSIALFSCCMC